jgi:superfamily II DNA or RNA helicase
MQVLRVWQREALIRYRDCLSNGEKEVLWEATPGAGKTTAALQLCLHQLKKHKARRVIIVVPTAHLKHQWAQSAANFRIQLDCNFKASANGLSRDFHGAAVTYQQIGNHPSYFRSFSENAIVVLDEVHHAADGLTWGNALRASFSKSQYILCLSGTAFRSDNNPIPFITYDKAGLSTPDYVYSYPQAIQDGVCRPVAFFTYGGEVAWNEQDQAVTASFGDKLDKIKSSRRLRAALDTDSGWIDTLLQDANVMLHEVRKEHPKAGALLVTADQDHARSLARLLQTISGVRPIVVLSDDNNASKKIKAFRDSNHPWLVACNMVSEGVDIPRLRVGVYATTVRTKMYFRQFLGRIVRRTNDVAGEEVAYCYLPADPSLKRLAEEVETEQRHSIRAKTNDEFDEQASEKERPDNEKPQWQALGGINTGIDTVILNGNQLTMFGNGTSTTSNPLYTDVESEEAMPQRSAPKTKSEVKADLAREIKQLVSAYRRRTGKGHAKIHTELNNRQAVKSQTQCTESQLEQRIKLLEQLLSQ